MFHRSSKVAKISFHGHNAGFASVMLVLLISVFAGALSLRALEETQIDRIEGIKYTQAKLQDIVQAMEKFVFLHHRLPCPAAWQVNFMQEQSTLGTETYDAAANSCHASSYIISGDMTETIYYGAVPFASLGLSRKQAVDYWQNKLYYVVSARFTQDALLMPETLTASTSALKIYANNEVMAQPIYLIISPGANAFGAIKLAATAKRNTNISTANYQTRPEEIANSLFDVADGNKISHLGQHFFIRAENANYFDDLLIYQTKEAMRNLLFSQQ